MQYRLIVESNKPKVLCERRVAALAEISATFLRTKGDYEISRELAKLPISVIYVSAV